MEVIVMKFLKLITLLLTLGLAFDASAMEPHKNSAFSVSSTRVGSSRPVTQPGNLLDARLEGSPSRTAPVAIGMAKSLSRGSPVTVVKVGPSDFDDLRHSVRLLHYDASRDPVTPLNPGRNSTDVRATPDRVVKRHSPLSVEERMRVMEDTMRVFSQGIGQDPSSSVVPTIGFVCHGNILIEVMQRARGKSLDSVFCQFGGQVSGHFYRVGQALARMHLKKLRNPEVDPSEYLGMIHGDFHAQNVCVSPVDRAVRGADECSVDFIDCITSVASIDKPQPICFDVLHFIFAPLFCGKVIDSPLLADWVTCLEKFLEGYVETFPQDKQARLIYHLQSLIAVWINTACWACDEKLALLQDIKACIQKDFIAGIRQERRAMAKTYTQLEGGVLTHLAELVESKNSIKKREALRNRLIDEVGVPLCKALSECKPQAARVGSAAAARSH